ncbi:MAG TPA: hypothetical protein VJ824_10895 [Bacillota bacterium]|nr:hypothetical protein [Bacillota bacterium]
MEEGGVIERLIEGEIFQRYLLELGFCKYYELKCLRHVHENKEKYEKYRARFLQHKKIAQKYYMQMKEMAVYSDFLEDESIFTESSFLERKD